MADDVVKKTDSDEESKEEKLRRAKIAMEGLDRTIRREANEKEEEASEEKQQLNKLLSSLEHEKELLELTWVNLDDKRASLKKILDPILEQEDKLESDETNIESQEEVTLVPKDRRELEQKRWQIQEQRKKTEEEKWVVEEKIEKIDDQIEEIKQKYQKLLAEEEDLRQKIQNIDERLLLQQEVLREQHDLEEQKHRQEALKQVTEQKQKEEAEKKRLAELKEIEEKKQQAEAERTEAEKTKKVEQTQADEEERLKKLRLAEEEKQKKETAQRQEVQKEQELAIKQKIANAIDNQKNETAPITPAVSVEITKKEGEKAEELRRALELERVKRENEESEIEKQSTFAKQNRSIISEIKEADGTLEPLRTLKGDLANALKNNQVSGSDLARVNKKIFPWAK